MSNSGHPVYSQCIQLEILETLSLTNDCYGLRVSMYFFLRAQRDNASMGDVKKTLSDIDLEFIHLKDWYTDHCWELLVGWLKPEEYHIGLVVEE